jgi:hypothetical protein
MYIFDHDLILFGNIFSNKIRYICYVTELILKNEVLYLYFNEEKKTINFINIKEYIPFLNNKFIL